MYNNSYSHSKLGVGAKKIHRAKGKSCGYYMRIAFFFSSLIQTLIIISLVLFLVYGQPDQSAAEKRLQLLDPIHNELKFRYGILREEYRNLSWNLNVTYRDMDFLNRNFTRLQNMSSESLSIIRGLQTKVIQCQMTPQSPPCNCHRMPPPSTTCTSSGQISVLQHENNQLKNFLDIVQRNFSETYHFLKNDLENTNRDKESLLQDQLMLRKEKLAAEREIESYKEKCKEDFIKPLSGVPEITRAFRQRIDTVFPQMIPFHISCPKQSEHLEQIQNNCSSLSKEVENKFQPYLDNIGSQVSNIIHKITHLEAKKWLLNSNLVECKQNLSSMEEQYHKHLKEAQERHDRTLDKVLLVQRNLREGKQLAEDALRLKESEISMLQAKLNNSLTGNGHKLPPSKSVVGNTGSSTTSSMKFPAWGGSSTSESRKSTVGGSGTVSGSGPTSMNFNQGASNTGAIHTSMSRTSSFGNLGNGEMGSNTGSYGSGSSRTGPGGSGSGSSHTSGSGGMGSNIGSYGAGSSRTGLSSSGLGLSIPSGSGGMGSNTGSYGLGSSRAGPAGSGLSHASGSGGMGSNIGSYGTGSSRTGVSSSGFGLSSPSGSGGMGSNTGSYGLGSSRAGPGGAESGSSHASGSGGMGSNTGSYGTGSSRTGTSSSGLGLSSPSGSGGMGSNTGSYGLGSSRAGSGGAGSGSSHASGSGGMESNTGSYGTGSSRTGSGVGSSSPFGSGRMVANTGSYGPGPSRTGMGNVGGFGGQNSFGSAGIGRSGHGSTMGMHGGGGFGSVDPVEKHVRELQKLLNLRRQ